jgi:carbon storage regulator
MGMLVLSRKKNEAICIGNDVKVQVVEIRGNVVRLGVLAPRNIDVHRNEVAARIASEEAAELRPVGGVPELPRVPFDEASAELMRPLLGVPFDAS